MTTRPRRRLEAFGWPGAATATEYHCDPGAAAPAANPLVIEVARPARTVAPTTRIGEVTEILRVSPYSAVPVTQNSRLVGIATERALVTALLAAPTDADRRRLREQPISDVMEAPPADFALPGERVTDAAARFDAAGADFLPVLEADGRLLGLLARSDLVQDLVRPFRPPVVGGMATPSGVYLTTGTVSGGVSTLALFGAGLAMFFLQILSAVAAHPLLDWAARRLPSLGAYPVLNALFGTVLPMVVIGALLLVLLRLSPVAGYHAAEHQVVHAIERAEPLLVDNVRAMPRVHPRCGTNLMAGALIAWAVYSLTAPILAQWSPALNEAAYAAGGIAALGYWRTLGSWLQRHLTTRPATTAQIESGIRAARQLLERHGRDPHASAPRPHIRLWRMGFLQMLGGTSLGWGLLYACKAVSPRLGVLLDPWLFLWLLHI